MGKFSFKAAFIVVLAFTVMMSVRVEIVEAKRWLHEEETSNDHDEALAPVQELALNPHCKPGCREKCSSMVTCYCECPGV